MNERLNRLIDQAGFVRFTADEDPDMPIDWASDYTEELNKFAELIVQECVKSALSLQDAAFNNRWGSQETFHMIVDTIAEDINMQHIFRKKE